MTHEKGNPMPETIESVEINASIEDVYDFLTVISNHIEISTVGREFRDHHGGQVQVGDQWVLVTDFMGREIVSDYECLALDAPTKLVFETTSDSADIHPTADSSDPSDGQYQISLLFGSTGF